MRLSLMKAAHDDVGGAPRQEIRVANLFGPCTPHGSQGLSQSSLVSFLILFFP
jgi:hypothetical protein